MIVFSSIKEYFSTISLGKLDKNMVEKYEYFINFDPENFAEFKLSRKDNKLDFILQNFDKF